MPFQEKAKPGNTFTYTSLLGPGLQKTRKVRHAAATIMAIVMGQADACFSALRTEIGDRMHHGSVPFALRWASSRRNPATKLTLGTRRM